MDSVGAELTPDKRKWYNYNNYNNTLYSVFWAVIESLEYNFLNIKIEIKTF